MYRLLAAAMGMVVLAAGVYFATDRPRSTATPAANRSVANDRAGTIVLGAIAPSPKDENARLQPLADYLSRRLQPLGVERGGVLIATTFGQMAELMRQGDVDLLIDSPFPIAKVRELSGA